MPTAVELLGITDTTDDNKVPFPLFYLTFLLQFGLGLRSTANAFAEAVNIFHDAEKLAGWKLKTEMKGDKCYNKHFPVGKVYSLRTEYPLPMQPLFENHWNEVGYLFFGDSSNLENRL